MQRRDSTEAVEGAKPVEAHHAEPTAISAPPREEAVTGTNWQPSEAAPSSPSKPKSPRTAESKERHISRSPERTIEATPHRSRPPRPRAAILHPAPIVIWRPAPGLKANPSPTVVRLPDPVAIAVRNPTFRFIRHPDLSVVRCVLPGSVGIQIFCANVILVGMLPRIRIADHAIAFAVPAVPVVPFGSGGDLVLRIGAGTAYRRHLALLHLADALGR